jgi:hypothetical protein
VSGDHAAATPPCPSWCDPQHCTVTPDDAHHRSIPCTIECQDSIWEMALGCTEERAHPEEWGRPPTLYLEVVSKTYGPPEAGEPMSLSDNLRYSDLLHLTAAFNAYLTRFPLPESMVVSTR